MLSNASSMIWNVLKGVLFVVCLYVESRLFLASRLCLLFFRIDIAFNRFQVSLIPAVLSTTSHLLPLFCISSVPSFINSCYSLYYYYYLQYKLFMSSSHFILSFVYQYSLSLLVSICYYNNSKLVSMFDCNHS